MRKRSQPHVAADPLVDEVRAVRKAICDRVGDDFGKLGRYLRRIGEQYRRKSGRFRKLGARGKRTGSAHSRA